MTARSDTLGSEAPISKHTSVRLDEHFQTFIAAQLREGRYRSANAVILAGLALLEHQVKLDALRAALIEGEQSGFIEDFDFDAFIEEKLQQDAVEAAKPAPPPHE